MKRGSLHCYRNKGNWEQQG